MTEADVERVACPGCGKNLPVNKDGSLRKHACAADQLDAAADDRPADPEQLQVRPATPEPLQVRPATAASTTRRRYCRVPNCGRTPRPNGLCTSHRLHHGLIE